MRYCSPPKERGQMKNRRLTSASAGPSRQDKTFTFSTSSILPEACSRSAANPYGSRFSKRSASTSTPGTRSLATGRLGRSSSRNCEAFAGHLANRGNAWRLAPTALGASAWPAATEPQRQPETSQPRGCSNDYETEYDRTKRARWTGGWPVCLLSHAPGAPPLSGIVTASAYEDCASSYENWNPMRLRTAVRFPLPCFASAYSPFLGPLRHRLHTIGFAA